MRRRPLLTAPLLALPWGAPARAAGGPRLAAQLYVWTQHFQAQGQTLADNLDEALAITAQAGFGRVEGFLDFFADDARAAETGAALRRNRISMEAAYAGGVMHDEGAAGKAADDLLARAKRARRCGVKLIVLNPAAAGEEKTDAQLDIQAAQVDRLAGALDKEGLRLALHAHDREMRANAREWWHLLRHTKAAICLDLHWAVRGGQDPLALLDAAGPRLADLHLRNSQGGIWTEAFGPGDLDYAAVARALRRQRYAGLLTVELAYEPKTPHTRSLADDLAQSRAFAKATFGV